MKLLPERTIIVLFSYFLLQSCSVWNEPYSEDRDEVIGTTLVDIDVRRSTLRTREAAAGNLVADATLWLARQAGLDVDLAVQNAGVIRSEVPGRLVMVARAFHSALDVARLDGRVYLTMSDADLV